MICNELKVVGLNITEDFYDYKGLFELCAKDKGLSVDLAELTDCKLKEIKALFDLQEEPEEIREVIMSKVFEAANTESRYVVGKDA